MKKILLVFALLGGASILTLNSCTKEYITNNNYLPGKSYVYPIKSNQWVRVGTTDTWLYEQRISDLDDVYFEDGHVSVAISYDNNQTSYEIIPAKIDDYSFSANYSIGVVRIYAEDLGTGPNISAPGDLITKIVLTDAEVGN